MPAEARGAVERFYDSIAGHYELVNGFLTLGLDGLWRLKAVSFVPDAGPLKCLDACCGTGNLTRLLYRRLPEGSSVTGADFSGEMLARARARLPGAEFVKSPASSLPFSDGTFDLLTLSFAARNLAASPGGFRPCLEEFLRVLRPGGLFIQLESSVPPSPFLKFLFRIYVKIMTGLAAALPPPDYRTAYRFLGSTVLSFMGAEKMSEELAGAGFSEVKFERLFFGAAAVHTAKKPGGRDGPFPRFEPQPF
jgi:demethylmenaquinone methyltransferase/2-methoxy-6-polyprenyl-1,4-benzoquinol methylase